MKKTELLTYIVYITFISIFFVGLASLINFAQNDDWVYRLNVEYFLQGNFKLHPYISPTFYTQGLMGMIFAYFFGISRLPVLTAILAIGSAVIFMYYLKNSFNLKPLAIVIITTLLVFNPLYVYSSLGFMTEQYFFIFLLLGLVLLDKYLKTKNYKFLVLLILDTTIGLFVRQVAMFIPLSLVLYFLYKKDLKNFAICLGWFSVFYIYIDRFFPKTSRMIEIPLQFQHYLKFNYLFANVWGILILLTAFFFPLCAFFVIQNLYREVKEKKYLKIFCVTAVTLFIFFGSRYLFDPQSVSWGEFPYFENTYERTGFYPRGIHGTKYQFRGNFKLYTYWDLAAKITLALFLAVLILKAKKSINVYAFFTIIYIGMSAITATFYDRYILPLLPIVISYILSKQSEEPSLNPDVKFGIAQKMVSSFFGIFLIFYGYNFAMDFVLTNRYVWTTSEEIAVKDNINPAEIQGTNAWKLSHRNPIRNYKFLVSYDSQEVNPDLKAYYELYEKKEIVYPLNFFINPFIYIYRLKNSL